MIRDIADDELTRLASQFATAVPFPHVVVEDLLIDAPVIARAVPDPRWRGWSTYVGNDYQPEKRIANDIAALPPPIRSVIDDCHTPRVLRALERISGIEKLIPDPYLNGGGLHCSTEGGVLLPHTDFHHYERLGLYRRLNVLIYLTEGWQDGDGGALELFGDRDANRPVVQVEPVLGRAVLFRTDHRSVHGFTEPVAPGKVRNSLALYYYTALEAPIYSGDTTTYWRRDRPAGGWRGLRLRVYRSLLFVARAIAWVAHRVNPSRMKDPTR